MSRAVRDKLWTVYRCNEDSSPASVDPFNLVEPLEIKQALDDASSNVRRHAVRFSDSFATNAALRKKLRTLSNDDDPCVRYELAFRESNDPERVPVLRSIIERDVEDSWTRAAVLNSLSEGAGNLFAAHFREVCALSTE